MSEILATTDSTANQTQQNATNGGSSNFKWAYAAEEMNSRRRNTMEDVHRIVPVLHPQLPDHSLFVIFDGHGGRQIVDFLEERFEQCVARELLATDSATIEERITRAFLVADMESASIKNSGATCVMALIRPHPEKPGVRQLVVANAGDSRAIVVSTVKPTEATSTCLNEKQMPTFECSSDTEEDGVEQLAAPIQYKDKPIYAHRLSYDHRPDDPEERSRIECCGGFIMRNRVLGILAVCRSFGDHVMKDYVTAQPHVLTVDLDTLEECPFLVLGCDGIFDVLSDQDTANVLTRCMLSQQNPSTSAQTLVDVALERGTMDNVTAIVVAL